tara:strand:+ start:8383 stop:8703 length:321 start_codon:yes stop_codon:yes gene_type:complete
MTLIEAVKANPSIVAVPEETILAAFIGRDIDHTEDYVFAQKKNVELVSADIYVAIANQPNFTEGALSVTYNPKVLMARARNIYLKYEDDQLSETGYSKVPLTITKV